MSEDKELGITTKADIEPHPAYIEIEKTKKPKVEIIATVNRQREVKIGG